MTSSVLTNDFVKLWNQIASAAHEALERVGQSGQVILGNEVASFEREIAQRTSRLHGIGVANGLEAIEIALVAAGLKPGDGVITTPMSAFATTLAIVRAQGVPIFVDVDKEGLLDLSLVPVAVGSHPHARFIVPVHLYGFPLNLADLKEVCLRHKLVCVEDCAQALGATWNDEVVGSVGCSAALSFYPTKNLGALGDAGAIVTSDHRMNECIRSLRDYGQTGKYKHDLLGYNSRLDEVHAAILLTALLPSLDKWTGRRREIAHAYLSGIQNHHIRIPTPPRESNPVWHLFPVLVHQPLRDEFRSFLSQRNIMTGVHYPFLACDQPAMRDIRFGTVGSLTNARRFAAEQVSLPIHPFLTDEEIEHVVTEVNSWNPVQGS